MSTLRPATLVPFMVMAGALSVLTADMDAGVVSVATAQTSASQQFSITIRNGKADTNLIRITQGQRIEIALASDQAAELHLHGYDLTAQLEPGVPAALSFLARIAGRFPVEAHRWGSAAKGRRHPGALFYVEVYPP